MRSVGTEAELYEQVAQYLRLKHPDVILHFDLSGLWTPSHRARNLYGRLNRRAWPDLFIAAPAAAERFREGFTDAAGLFIELKREGTRLRKRDGSWASAHIAEQAAVLEELRVQGYRAEFAVGYAGAVASVERFIG